MKFLLAASALALGMAAPASAVVVISDDFNSYSGSQVPWNGSGVWTTGNSVDLVRSGDYSLTCVGGTGNCVDLSGDRNGSISRVVNLAAGSYVFSFAYTGNQLSFDPEAGFTAALGGNSFVFGPLSNVGSNFTTFTSGRLTLAGPTTLSFTQNGGDQFRGSIIDNVSIAAVPEPATWSLMILGFGVVGGALRSSRRRRSALAVA